MLNVTVSKGEETTYENAIGYSSIEDKTPNSTDTRFRIGSITKTFTSVMIFQLIESGDLTLETPLADYFPQIQNSDTVLIKHLLSHESGIRSFTNDPDSYKTYATSGISKEDLLSIISNYSPAFKPGEKREYSNSNFVLLGYILEEITDSIYSQQLQKRICEPLSLSNTYFGEKIGAHKNEAHSYQFVDGSWILQPETDMSVPHGAGAIVSNNHDIIRFIRALFKGELVSSASLESMKGTGQGQSGMGLAKIPFANRVAFGHNGGIDGFRSNLAYFPEEDLAISATANGVNYDFNTVLINVLKDHFGQNFELPDLNRQPVAINASTLESFTGLYTSETIPLDLTLFVQASALHAQATGQGAFPLTPFSETEFKFEAADIAITFTNLDNTESASPSFLLTQRGMKHEFTRKKKQE